MSILLRFLNIEIELTCDDPEITGHIKHFVTMNGGAFTDRDRSDREIAMIIRRSTSFDEEVRKDDIISENPKSVLRVEHCVYIARLPNYFIRTDFSTMTIEIVLNGAGSIPWRTTVINLWLDPVAQLLKKYGRFIIHAALVRKSTNSQDTLLLLGRSGSGKTTLGLDLHSYGYHFLADDLVVIACDERDAIIGQPIHAGYGITHASWNITDERLYTIHSNNKTYYIAPSIHEEGPFSIKKIVFLQLSEGEAKMIPLTTMEAFQLFTSMQANIWSPYLMEEFNLRKRLMKQATTYKLVGSQSDYLQQMMSIMETRRL